MGKHWLANGKNTTTNSNSNRTRSTTSRRLQRSRQRNNTRNATRTSYNSSRKQTTILIKQKFREAFPPDLYGALRRRITNFYTMQPGEKFFHDLNGEDQNPPNNREVQQQIETTQQTPNGASYADTFQPFAEEDPTIDLEFLNEFDLFTP